MPVAFDRTAMLERLAGETFDVLVIGGGVTGAGVALDAASRGLRTALVEADDFASGTSSKSSKLVHGGLRYLQNRDVRPRLPGTTRAKAPPPQRPAPRQDPAVPHPDHDEGRSAPPPRRPRPRRGDVDVRPHRRLAHRQAASAPQARRGVRPPADAAPRSCRRRLPLLRRHGRRRPPRADARADRRRSWRRRRQPLPGRGVEPWRRRCGHRGPGRSRRRRRLRHPGHGGGERHRGVGRRAAGDGGRRRRSFDPAGQGRPRDGPVGVGAQRHRRGHPGPRRQAQPVRGAVGSASRRHVRPHLHRHHRHRLRRSARRSAVHRRRHRLRARGGQRRARPGHVRADHRASRSPGCGPGCGRSCVRPSVPAPPTCRASTTSTSARVGWSASPGASSTTYREMAEDTVDTVLARLGRKARCRTRSLLLRGADGFVDSPPGTRDAHLADRYGSGRSAIDALIAADGSLGAPLVEGLPYERAEAVHAVRAEMAITLTDVLTRRTRCPPARSRRNPDRRPGRRRAAGRRAGLGRRRDRPSARRLRGAGRARAGRGARARRARRGAGGRGGARVVTTTAAAR